MHVFHVAVCLNGAASSKTAMKNRQAILSIFTCNQMLSLKQARNVLNIMENSWITVLEIAEDLQVIVVSVETIIHSHLKLKH